MLLRTVDDRSHALLYGAILCVDTVDASERLRLLDLAIDEPVVALVPEGAELAPLLDVIGTVPVPAFQPVLFGEGLLSEAVHPVPHRAVLVIDGHPHVPGDHGPGASVATAPDLLGPDLREGHDEVISAHVALVLVEGPDPRISVPVVGDVDLQDRLAAADERPPTPGARPRPACA